MPRQVLLTEGAVHDLEDLYDYISAHDSPAKADYVLDSIEKKLNDLLQFPERGSIPFELDEFGIREYRQVVFKPYRIIYRLIDDNVYVYLIVDGRRDMQGLLVRRLIRQS
jgi:toxin ParE1/3/4